MITLPILTVQKVAGICFLLLMGFTAPQQNLHTTKNTGPAEQTAAQATALEGAWRLSNRSGKGARAADGETTVKIIADGYFSAAVFDQEQKKFYGTYGGTYALENGNITEAYEFNTLDSTQVGSTDTGSYTLANNRLQIKHTDGGTETWEKMPAAGTQSPLTGAWRISGRQNQEGEMSTIPLGARKTIKILAGECFQWIAFNSETAGFFGTGGGTFTTKNGNYIENIEFFSRDSSRVGQQLTFDYEIKDGNWHHSGLSSKGNKINEIWTRVTRP